MSSSRRFSEYRASGVASRGTTTTVELMPTPLVDWLRAQDDETLAALLRLRPDLAVPPPADLTVLATRAGHPGLGAPGLRRPRHRHARRAGGPRRRRRGPRARARAPSCARLLGPDVPAAALDTRSRRPCATRALVWGARRRARRWSRPPATWCRATPAAWAARRRGGRVVGAARAARRGRRRTSAACSTRSPPARRSAAAGRGADPASPVGRLLARGLLLRVDPETVELPRQVGLALRGDRPLGAVAVHPPDVGRRDRGADVVDRTAGGAALELLRRVELLIAFWGRTPPPLLRSGGLGVRELRRAAKEIDTDETTAALLVELAVAADLVAETDGVTPGVGAHHRRPTCGPPAARSCAGRCWPAPGWSCPGCPGLVGRKDDAGKPITALSDGVAPPAGPAGPPPGARRARRAARPAAPRLAPAQLADLLAWRAPRRGGRLRDEVVAWTLAEATALGVVALDALSTTRAGRCSTTRTGSSPALRATLPAPVDHVLLQADLTAVAPGPLEAGLAARARPGGRRRVGGRAPPSTGSPRPSIRRALDAGPQRRRPARPARHPLGHPGAAGADLPRRRRRPPARTAARRRGGVVPALRRRGAASPRCSPTRTPIGLELRRIAPTVVVSAAAARRAAGRAARGRVQPGRRGPRRARCWTSPTAAAAPHRGRRRPPGPVPRRSRTPRSSRALVSRMRAGRRAGRGASRGRAVRRTGRPWSILLRRGRASGAGCGSGSSTGTGWRGSGCWRRSASAAGWSRAATTVDGARAPRSRCTGSRASRVVDG